MSFTNLDVPLPDRFQLSFGFQTFQPSGTLLNHQTRVRGGMFELRFWLHSSCPEQRRDLEGRGLRHFICYHVSNSPPGADPEGNPARSCLVIDRAGFVCIEKSFPFFADKC